MEDYKTNERALIYGCLTDIEKAKSTIEQLSDNDFIYQPHKVIIKAVTDVVLQNRTPDVTTIIPLINDQENEFYYLQYMSEMMNECYLYRSYNFDLLIERQKEYSKKSFLIKTAEEILHYAENRTSDDLINLMNHRVSQIKADSLKGLVPMNIAVADYLSKVESDSAVGISTGYLKFDAHTGGLKGGQMIVIGGKTGEGKSSIAFNIASNVAKEHPVLYVSREMSPEEMAIRYMAFNTEISMKNMSNLKLTKKEKETLKGYAPTVTNSLYIDNVSSSVADIRSKAFYLNAKKQLGLIVVDYLQLLEGNGLNDVQNIDMNTRELKLLAMDLNVPVIVLSQLNNEAYRDGAKIKLNHLRGSGSIPQNADMVLLLIRDEKQPDQAKLVMLKSRNTSLIKFYLQFDGSKTLYTQK